MSTIPAAPPPRASNTPALLALVFGIIALAIGWVPICGSIPALCFALAGLPLGFAGLSAVRRRPNLGRAVPLTGLILSCLGLLLAAASTVMPIVALTRVGQAIVAQAEAEEQRRDAAARAPFSFRDASLFFVSSDSHLAGTGFLVDTGTALYAITAEHPFEGEIPRSFLHDMLEPGGDVALGERIWRGDDVQALRLAAAAPASARALHYPGPMPVRDGDRVAILTMDGPALATVTQAGHFLSSVATLDAPLKAAGLSGSPVVLEQTGTPIGVLVGADDAEKATLVEFVRLGMPPDPTSRPRRAP